MNKYFVIQKLNVSINHPKTTLRFKISYRHIQQQGQLLWVRVHSAYVRNVLFHRIAEEFIQPLNPTSFSKQGQLGQKLLWNLTSWNLSNSVDEGFMSSLAESLFLCLTLLMVKSFFKNFTGAFFTATSVHCLSFYYCATLTRVWHFFLYTLSVCHLWTTIKSPFCLLLQMILSPASTMYQLYIYYKVADYNNSIQLSN